MGTDSDAAGRSVRLAVEPHLLEDLLGRLLQADGWTVRSEERADVVVRSPTVSVDVSDGSRLTVVLPDEDGAAGQVRWAGQPPEALPPGPGLLEIVLGILGPALPA